MLTVLTIDHEARTIGLAALDATAASGDVLPGAPGSYTDREIRDHCNETLCAPETGDYSNYAIARD